MTGVSTPNPAPPPGPAASAAARVRALVDGRRRFIPVAVSGLVLVLLFAVGSVRYTGFLDPQVMLNLLVNNSFLIVLAVG